MARENVLVASGCLESVRQARSSLAPPSPLAPLCAPFCSQGSRGGSLHRSTGKPSIRSRWRRPERGRAYRRNRTPLGQTRRRRGGDGTAPPLLSGCPEQLRTHGVSQRARTRRGCLSPAVELSQLPHEKVRRHRRQDSQHGYQPTSRR